MCGMEIRNRWLEAVICWRDVVPDHFSKRDMSPSRMAFEVGLGVGVMTVTSSLSYDIVKGVCNCS